MPRLKLFFQIVFRQWEGVRLWPWTAWKIVYPMDLRKPKTTRRNR